TNRLVAASKQQRKQSKAVRDAVRSPREPRELGEGRLARPRTNRPERRRAMNAPYRAHADPPPKTLTDRVRQLNDNLQRLAVRWKDASAAAIGRAVADAVRDGVSGLLGVEEQPQRGLEYHDDRHRFGRYDRDDQDDHRDEDDGWRDDDRLPIPS